MSDLQKSQQELWKAWQAKLEQDPTPENYARAYNEVNAFLKDHGDPAKGRLPDGTVLGPSGAIDDWEKRIIVQLAGEKAMQVVEFGCGDGRMALAICSRGATVKALDISEVAIENARQRAAGLSANVSFAVGNAFACNEPANFFDYAVSCDMVEHLNPNQVPAHLREVRRVLKPGGAYIVSLPVWTPADQLDPLHLGNYHRAEFKKLLTEAGFQAHSAPEVYFARAGDLDLLFGPPRTTRAKCMRALSRLPGLAGLIGLCSVRRWFGNLNFYFAKKTLT